MYIEEFLYHLLYPEKSIEKILMKINSQKRILMFKHAIIYILILFINYLILNYFTKDFINKILILLEFVIASIVN